MSNYSLISLCDIDSQKKIIKDNNRCMYNYSVWLMLVIVWNYIFYTATPLQDVLVAMCLSGVIPLLKKLSEKKT